MPRARKRLYTVWWNMLERCNNPNNHNYHGYGGRGISVCDDWLGSCGYKNFEKWAINNGYKENLTIDRIDVNKGYDSTNCRWVTITEQANNRRTNRIITYKNVTDTLANICRKFDKDYMLVNNRLQKGWEVQKALDTPKYSSRKNGRYITYDGKTKSIAEWTRELHLSKNTIYERLNSGWTVEEALFIEKGGRKHGN